MKPQYMLTKKPPKTFPSSSPFEQVIKVTDDIDDMAATIHSRFAQEGSIHFNLYKVEPIDINVDNPHIDFPEEPDAS